MNNNRIRNCVICYGGDNMHYGSKFFTLLFLTVALASTMVWAQQDDEHHGDNQRQEQDQAQQRDQRDQQHQNQQRIYDSSHHDYHQWNENEDHTYRQYLSEHHKQYRDFQSESSKQQNQYWNWRHSHPDQNHPDNRSDHDNH